ncbi:hypothetical protein [Nitrobacter sp. JJSN]|uniref:hypothetical protein n=1 Tax=Nitrobacter sp. JJSN TaxID=3453033 RepID=UPI003F76A22B
MAQFRQCYCESSETAWLSMLVETLEKLSVPEARAVPCDAGDLVAAKAHLAHSASFTATTNRTAA